MDQTTAGESRHEYRGWKIRITDKTVDTHHSSKIEVWAPGVDPRGGGTQYVSFLGRTASRQEAQEAALMAAKKWIDRETNKDLS